MGALKVSPKASLGRPEGLQDWFRSRIGLVVDAWELAGDIEADFEAFRGHPLSAQDRRWVRAILEDEGAVYETRHGVRGVRHVRLRRPGDRRETTLPDTAYIEESCIEEGDVWHQPLPYDRTTDIGEAA